MFAVTDMSIGLQEIILVVLVLVVTVGVPLVVIVGVILFLNKRRQGNTKKCASCASVIPVEAKVCRFCGRDVAMNVGA